MSHLEDVWRPQIEKALWEADCGAEVAKYESGHRTYRIPEDNVSMLEPTAENSIDGLGWKMAGSKWGSGYGIRIDTGYGPSGVFELYNPRAKHLYEYTIGDWKPLQEPKTQTKNRRKRK